ncbi:MAG: hypothetical protein ABEJ65_12515 [bacterium]
MDSWYLKTKNNSYYITEQEIRSTNEITEDIPVIVGPSLCYRKFFQIPTDTDRPRNEIALEAFNSFLPGQPSEFICQFHFNEISENGEPLYKVMGLGIREEDYQSIGDSSPVYLLEYLLREQKADSRALLTLSLPEGEFWGYFDPVMNWSRYLRSPDSEQKQSALDQFNTEFGSNYSEYNSPEFTEEDGSDWIEFLNNWITGDLKQIPQLGGTTLQKTWESVQGLAWTALLLLMAGTCLFAINEIQLTSNYQKWIRTHTQRQLENPGENPLQSAKKELKQRRKMFRATRGKRRIYHYPRIVDIENVLNKHDIRLLRLDLRKANGKLIILSPELRQAEKLVSELARKDGIRQAQINNSNSVSIENYQYEITVDVRWSTNKS